ncbi:MAG: blue-copper protein [Gemmatimonadetes bacterium]|nr:blue-copper protein [Gemmatimonadota bacterium]
MRTFARDLAKLPLLGLLAFAAACGGDKKTDQSAAPAGNNEATSAAPAAPATAPAAAPATAGKTIEVKMLTTNGGAAGKFEPAEITAKVGDVLHFTTDGVTQHNVDFPAADNPAGVQLPAPSAYLAAGGSYDVPVTMAAGTYHFQCDPHAPMGMKGVLTVTQ